MKLSTHVIFAVGVCTLSSSLLGLQSFQVLSIWGVAALQQVLIDKLSHEFRGRYRTPLFHSIVGVTILSFALTSLIIALNPTSYLDRYTLLSYLIVLLLSGYSHLMLDALNPGGIFILGKRTSIARIKYDDPLANFLFQVIGASMIIYGILLRL